MQVCTSLQTDNHASTPPLCFLQAGCPSCHPTNSIKALKATNMQCNLTKFSTATYYYRCYLIISGIYTNFHIFLCKKCDVGYYVINHGVYRRRSCCNTISVSNKGYSARHISVEKLAVWTNFNTEEKDDTDSNIKHCMFTSQVIKLMITG